jgi:electron transfer flavoprotein beta subunit
LIPDNSQNARHQVTVLVSTSRHPVSGAPYPSRNDAKALEMARRMSGFAPRVLHVGNSQDPALSDYLAFGAAVIEVLAHVAGIHRVTALARQLVQAQLTLCGSRAEDGIASGMLPYSLAAKLGRPIVTDALEVALSNSTVQLVQFLPKGQRRRVEVPLPAIVTVHPLAAVEPRYVYARRRAGRIDVLPLECDPHGASDDTWIVDSNERAPIRLKAPDSRTGHARMLAATHSASHTGGRLVVEGSAQSKARIVLDYLREHRLIDV